MRRTTSARGVEVVHRQQILPNLPVHIDIASQAAGRLRHGTLAAYPGHYLLGSTSPDVRAITHSPREEYHFAPLSFENVGAGIDGMFEAHPHLRRPANIEGPSAAFVAGYVTHILLDELWITEVYRPRFGDLGDFGDGVGRMVMDRALQLELDRMSWGAVEAALPIIEQATASVDVGFIPSDTLSQWRGWVLELLGRGFSWDRLRFMARRIARGDDDHPAHGVADEFLEAMPESLDLLLERVTRDDLDNFKERSVERLTGALEDYLS